MASEVHELLVRLRPEGAKETREELEATTEQFDASAAQTEEAAGAMSAFADKFKGAMQVVVAGLAVASAGLLSQVPVIGEAASGFFAIVDAIAFKMDRVLRPVIQPIAEGLFRIADAINRAEGPFGTFLGVIATAASLLGLLEGAVLLVNAAFGLSLTGPIAAIVAFLGGPLTLAILAIVALVGLLLYAWSQNWGDIQGKTAAAISFIKGVIDSAVSYLTTLWKTFLSGGLLAVAIKLLGDLVNLWGTVFEKILGFFAPFIGEALRFVFGLFNKWLTFQDMKLAALRTAFETFFDLVINKAKGFVNSFASIIQRGVNRIVDSVPEEMRSQLGISAVNVSRPFNAQSTSEVLASGEERLRSRLSSARDSAATRQSEADRQIERLVTAMQNTDLSFAVNLDSREVARDTKPFMDEGTAARGR